MAPLVGVERRDADKTMDPRFLAQMAEGIVAFDADSNALDTGLFPGKEVKDFRGISLALGIAKVHPQQHLSPVLGFGAAGPRVDRQDGVAAVILIVEQRPQLGLGQHFAERARRPAEVFDHVFALSRQLGKDLDLFFFFRQTAVRLKVTFQFLFFLLQGLRSFLVLPGLGLGELPVEGSKLGLLVF
jgi:hypothetical protein